MWSLNRGGLFIGVVAQAGLTVNQWSKTVFLVIMHTIFWPLSEKPRGPQQNLGAYATGRLGNSNPVFRYSCWLLLHILWIDIGALKASDM